MSTILLNARASRPPQPSMRSSQPRTILEISVLLRIDNGHGRTVFHFHSPIPWSLFNKLRQIVGKQKYPTLGHQTSMYQ